MKPLHLALATTLLGLAALPALAAEPEKGIGQYNISRSDIPEDAPQFEDYPAKPYEGPNATPDVQSDPASRRYATRLRNAAKEKPNFAGQFIVAKWECGKDCTQMAIIDARTGKIFHPGGLTRIFATNVDPSLLGGGDLFGRAHSTGAIWHRPDSRLLVIVGAPEKRQRSHGISYYVWDGARLKRIRFVPKP